MSYIGKNPKFNSTVLTDVGLAVVDSPASGSHKLVNRGGTVKVLDSAGSESSLGGGSGEINLVDNSSDAGNWAASGAGVTVATTTTATDLPLGGVIDTAIKLTPVSGTDYARYRFTMPAGLKNRKLKIEWFQRPLSGYTSGDFKVEMYKNAASNYSGAYTEFNLSTDSSGVTGIPNATGKFTTTFDADDGDYYELRYVRVAGTTALNLASVIVGPGTQPQGAVVGSPVSLTFTSNQTGGTHTITAFGERVGSSLHVKLKAVQTVSAGTQASAYTLTMPAGLSIDLAALPGGTNSIAGMHTFDNSAFGNAARAFAATSTTIVFRKGGFSANIPGTDFQVNYELQSEMTLPIAEWAGSGTVNLAQNDVEYASNTAASGGTGTNDLVSFAYGPSGSLIGSISTAIVRRVRFQTPIKPSDTLVLEFSNDRVTWWPVTSIATVGGGDFGQGTTRQGSFFYGAGIYNNNANGTDLDVQFGNYAAVSNSASYAAAGIAWSASAGSAYWRVKKQAAGAAVGFGLADATTSGLYSPNTMFTNNVMPAFKVDKNTANQTYTGAGSGQQVTWSEGSSTAFDQGNNFSSNVFTVPAGAGGIYTFSVGLLSSIPTLQSGNTFIRKNGVFVAGSRTFNANGSTRDFTNNITITLKLVPGDTVDVMYASSSGPSVTIVGDIQETYFSGKRDY